MCLLFLLFIFSVQLSASVSITFNDQGHADMCIKAFEKCTEQLDFSNVKKVDDKIGENKVPVPSKIPALSEIEEKLKIANSLLHKDGHFYYDLNKDYYERKDVKNSYLDSDETYKLCRDYYRDQTKVNKVDHREHFNFVIFEEEGGKYERGKQFQERYDQYQNLEKWLNHQKGVQSNNSAYLVDSTRISVNNEQKDCFYFHTKNTAKAILKAFEHVENYKLQQSREERYQSYERIAKTFFNEYQKTCIILCLITGSSLLYSSGSLLKALALRLRKNK